MWLAKESECRGVSTVAVNQPCYGMAIEWAGDFAHIRDVTKPLGVALFSALYYMHDDWACWCVAQHSTEHTERGEKENESKQQRERMCTLKFTFPTATTTSTATCFTAQLVIIPEIGHRRSALFSEFFIDLASKTWKSAQTHDEHQTETSTKNHRLSDQAQRIDKSSRCAAILNLLNGIWLVFFSYWST